MDLRELRDHEYLWEKENIKKYIVSIFLLLKAPNCDKFYKVNQELKRILKGTKNGGKTFFQELH